MPSSLDRDFQTEAEYLRQASLYVGRSEIEDAIALLERARLLVPVTNRLLNTLGKLYLTAGKPAQAAGCFESVLNRKPKIEVYEDLPADEDMQYLAEQSHQLNEKEYSFEVSGEKINVVPVRKILSLGTKKAVQDKKIIFKNKPLLSVPEKPEDKLPEVKQSIDEYPRSSDQIDSDDFMPSVHNRYEDYFQSDGGDDCSSELVDLDGYFHEQDVVLDYGISIVDIQDVDLNDVDAEIDQFDGGIEYGAAELPDLVVEPEREFDIYDHWTDDPLDSIEEDIDAGVLGDRLSREQRARQAAVECLGVIDWDKSALSFLTDVFIELGWNNARKALEQEVFAGASYDELCLAFHIKQIWSECDRYWISFTGAWLPGETTSAIYRHCSWRQALRLIRVFNGVPCSEEIWDLVESEFEFWYDDRVMRTRFPAFSKYLFSYRFNKSLPTLPIGECRRFDIDVAFDEMNAPWSYQPQSDEIRILGEYGVDIVNRYAPKSYYSSDKKFDPRSLDLSTTKKDSAEKVFDDETF